MARADVEYVAAVREALTGLYDGFVQLRASEPPHQAKGSLADVEQSDPKWAQDALNACTTGFSLLESGGEHVTAFVKNVTEPVETIACWTSVRSMLTPCAIACWLFDPTADAKERTARILALRYEGIEQEIKYLRVVGKVPANVIEDLEDKLDSFDQKSLGFGFPRLRDKAGKRNGAGMRMPTDTKLITEYLDAESDYRLLSAIAHGHQWAISQLGFRRVTGADFVTAAGVKVTHLEKHLSASLVGYLALTATEAFGKACTEYFRYVGFDVAAVESLVTDTVANLRP